MIMNDPVCDTTIRRCVENLIRETTLPVEVIASITACPVFFVDEIKNSIR